MARVLLAKPDFLFLDEATSALDSAGEAEIYQVLIEKLPGSAIVSIGHRSTLDKFHTRQIGMSKAGDGLFAPVDAVPQAAE